MSKPKRLYSWDDFEASIRILTPEEGGRTCAAFNSIRWDVVYNDVLYMIWPDFVDELGSSMPQDQPLPTGVDLKARMFIAVDEMREKQHRMHITVGMKFYCHEGGHRVAEGIVTRITGLFDDRSPG